MADQSKQTGGVPFHVGECYIWAAISYLDSPTDYRECLAQDSAQLRSRASDLIMLDSLQHRPVIPSWTVSLVLLLLAAMFVYAVW
jgi:hypothetical protein